MTTQQLNRWRRLARGLALATPKADRPRVLGLVDGLIDYVIAGVDLDRIRDWDGNQGSVYVCDRVTDWLSDEGLEDEHGERTPIGMDVSACVRAGFDVAVKPSGGVVGFTVADLRRAFHGRIPKWVRNWFDPPLSIRARRGDVWL